MFSRAMVHAVFVALVVVLAVEVPDLDDRPTPDWLVELCQQYDDVCGPEMQVPSTRR